MEVIIESFIKTIQVLTKLEPILIEKSMQGTYCSKITIHNHNFYFSYDRDFLLILSQTLLFESSPSEADLIDIANEFANLVVGQAKVLYQAKQIDMQIGTPVFITHFNPTSSSKAICYQVGQGKCNIYKE